MASGVYLRLSDVEGAPVGLSERGPAPQDLRKARGVPLPASKFWLTVILGPQATGQGTGGLEGPPW